MPKMKTHKGAASRLSMTATGKLRRRHHEQSHLRRKKTKTVKRTYDKQELVFEGDAKRIVKRLLPYGIK